MYFGIAILDLDQSRSKFVPVFYNIMILWQLLNKKEYVIKFQSYNATNTIITEYYKNINTTEINTRSKFSYNNV